MRKVVFLVALVAVVGMMIAPVASRADTDPCNGTIGGITVRGNKTPVLSTGFIVPVTDKNTGPLYVDVRDLANDDWAFSLWVYQETNKVAGLQRGGHRIFPETPATG